MPKDLRSLLITQVVLHHGMLFLTGQMVAHLKAKHIGLMAQASSYPYQQDL